MSEPVDVYLDVDGVLNAVCVSDPRWGWPDCERVTVNGFVITYSPTMVERLNALAEREHVQFFWLTTWLHDAVELLAPAIGLKAFEWPVLEPADNYVGPDSIQWWKLKAIEAHSLTRGHRVLWVDDDIPYEDNAMRWLSRERNKGRLIEVVSPATYQGLTAQHMAYIEEWVG